MPERQRAKRTPQRSCCSLACTPDREKQIDAEFRRDCKPLASVRRLGPSTGQRHTSVKASLGVERETIDALDEWEREKLILHPRRAKLKDSQRI